MLTCMGFYSKPVKFKFQVLIRKPMGVMEMSSILTAVMDGFMGTCMSKVTKL